LISGSAAAAAEECEAKQLTGYYSKNGADSQCREIKFLVFLTSAAPGESGDKKRLMRKKIVYNSENHLGLHSPHEGAV
jgi:hypothetical protein